MATSIVETITPVIAQKYLNTSLGNRNISKPTVNSYALTMQRGEWMLNGEAIVFDINGHLINGHHRLHAIIKADIPVQSFVTRGVDSSAFVTFDCGRHRTVGQLIGMQNIKHYNAVASTVNFAENLREGKAVSDNVSRKNNKSNLAVMDVFNMDREAYIDAAFTAKRLVNLYHRTLDVSVVGGTIYFLIKYCGYKKDFVVDFFNKIMAVSTCEPKALDLLRSRIINIKMAHTVKMPRKTMYALIVKTWNYYVMEQEVKQLKWTEETESFPKFIVNDGTLPIFNKNLFTEC